MVQRSDDLRQLDRLTNIEQSTYMHMQIEIKLLDLGYLHQCFPVPLTNISCSKTSTKKSFPPLWEREHTCTCNTLIHTNYNIPQASNPFLQLQVIYVHVHACKSHLQYICLHGNPHSSCTNINAWYFMLQCFSPFHLEYPRSWLDVKLRFTNLHACTCSGKYIITRLMLNEVHPWLLCLTDMYIYILRM